MLSLQYYVMSSRSRFVKLVIWIVYAISGLGIIDGAVGCTFVGKLGPASLVDGIGCLISINLSIVSIFVSTFYAALIMGWIMGIFVLAPPLEVLQVVFLYAIEPLIS